MDYSDARPDVSVVVCTYNRAPSLRLTLEALDAQVTPSDLTWELVVVDNNSTDATRAEIERFAARARIRVRWIFVPTQGLSHARNAGLAESRGHIVAFTDDDVRPEPDWVARLAAVMRERHADIVGGRIMPDWLRPPPAWLAHRPSFHGAVAIMTHSMPAEILNPRSTPSVWGANMAFRRDVFDKVGVFDARRGLVGSRLYRGEEIDLIERALAVGCRVVYDPAVVVWHRIGADRMRIGYLSRLHFQRAEGDALVLTDASVPLSRTMARALASLAAAVLRRTDAMERWLGCCAAAGSAWGACKARFGKRTTGR